jgi:hypothetical protein
LSSGIPGDPGAGTYGAEPGYQFLVVDVEMNFGASSTLSSDDIRVVTDDGTSYSAFGMKFGLDFMMGGFSGDFGKTYDGTLVFLIPEDSMAASFSLSYKDLVSTPFSVS